MEEIWKDIKEYEGLYQVSNLGRVKSLGRWVYKEYRGKRWQGEKILKQIKNKFGYLRVYLYKNGKAKCYAIHRLVAQVFIPNPYNLPQVNHKDEDKTNNCVSNLEFCTNKFNANYGTRNERISEKLNGRHHTEETKKKLSKIVLQIDKNTNEVIAEFSSTIEAKRQLGYSTGHISSCCRGKIKTYKNFIWRYKESVA